MTSSGRRTVLLAASLLGVAVVSVGGFLVIPERAERVRVALAGGDPTASPVSAERTDVPYPEDPLEVSLRLESALVDVNAPQALAFADALARELGWWTLAEVGASDVEEAERLLWARSDGRSAFLGAWTAALARREVHARTTEPGLWTGGRAEPPIYVQPDELPLLMLRVARALDLRMELAEGERSHLRVVWREPGGDRVAAIDLSGPEPALTEPPTSAPTPVTPEHLADALLPAIVGRHDVDVARIEERIAGPADAPLARLAFRRRLAAGLAAWERGDGAVVKAEAAALAAARSAHPDLSPPEPDERVLEAMVAFDGGRDEDARAARSAVLAFWEPDGVPAPHARSDAHAAAMWLLLEYGPATPADWEVRVGPLMEHARGDPGRRVRLCALGRDLLHDTERTVEETAPECAPPPP